MKKVIALLLAMMMMVGMLAGCGGGSGEGGAATQQPGAESAASGGEENPGGEADIPLDGSWPAEKVKIGVVAFDTTDESFMAVMDYFDYLAKSFNVEIIISEAIQSAEQEFAFIDNCKAAGCQGIFAYYNVAGAEAIKHATSQEMYYWGIEQYYADVADDPYYVGTYTFNNPDDPSAQNGDYQAGYELGMAMGSAGLDHIAFCNGGASFGVQMFIDRQQGFFDGVAAAQAAGSATRFDPAADVIEGFPGDAYFAAQAAFFAEDYDGVAVSFDAFTWFQPILDNGKDIKVGCVGTVSETYKSFVDNGTVIALVYDCGEYVFGSGFANLVNAATGHVELTRNADGKALLNPAQRWVLSSADDFNAVYDKHIAQGEFFITAEDMAGILGGVNADATVDDVCALFNVSLEDALK